MKHKRVFKYDGAFKCLDCNKSWEALPDHPEKPDNCIPENKSYG